MLVNGDKLIVTKTVANFLMEGDIVEVVDVSENGMITFAFGDGFIHKGLMTESEFEEHFKKIENKPTTVTEEWVHEIMENSEYMVDTVFDKCTIVSCRLPNGFVIVESSACVDPKNYNEEMGSNICLDKIEAKIWELEGYRLQEELYRSKVEPTECYYGYDNCEECDCEDCCEECEEDECLGCDDCDCDCPYNFLH